MIGIQVNRSGKAHNRSESSGSLLLELAEGAKGQRYTVIPPEGGIIGRDAECHLILNDEAVSRHHCRICLDNDLWIVRDLNSQNGVFVNGRKVSEHFLWNGDTIRIGKSRLRCMAVTDTDEFFLPMETPPRRSNAETTWKTHRSRLIGIVAGLLLLALAWHGVRHGRNGSHAGSPPQWLEARVSYNGESFQIVNLGAYDWENVTLEVEPAASEPPYVLKLDATLSPGTRYTITASNLVNDQGTLFDPDKNTPAALVIRAGTSEGSGYHEFVMPGKPGHK